MSRRGFLEPLVLVTDSMTTYISKLKVNATISELDIIQNADDYEFATNLLSFIKRGDYLPSRSLKHTKNLLAIFDNGNSQKELAELLGCSYPVLYRYSTIIIDAFLSVFPVDFVELWKNRDFETINSYITSWGISNLNNKFDNITGYLPWEQIKKPKSKVELVKEAKELSHIPSEELDKILSIMQSFVNANSTLMTLINDTDSLEVLFKVKYAIEKRYPLDCRLFLFLEQVGGGESNGNSSFK